MANVRRRYIILLIILFVISACTSTKFDLYEGKLLNIAVIGVPPQIKEEQVNFKEISFNDLNKGDLDKYDAVLVMSENLKQAAERRYSDIYTNSLIPFFFISTTSHIPFTEKNIEYEEAWEWSPGNSYAVGVYKSIEDDSLKNWGLSLYNDEKTDENIKGLYSRIFIEIEELAIKKRG
ncbi:hypothetical protein [Paenibacillus dakarensis]|uniref:hypothetical protein n=1 Tax=Paenibacillus dakarensis TaxID=1527293 RepID=UPI0006D5699B|nr:hypothetical protein [Paenibacillus dakarensis]